MLTLLRRWESFSPRSLQSTFPEINQKLINFSYEDRPRELGFFSLEKRPYLMWPFNMQRGLTRKMETIYKGLE